MKMPKRSQRPEETACKAALRIWADRDFRRWRGLPAGCSLTDVTSVFPLLNDGVGMSILGEQNADFRMVMVDGYDSPVRVWSNDDHVLMLDVEFPQLSTSLDALLAELGEPEARLDSFLSTLRLEQSEWVYPSRGLTLFINPDNDVLLRLAVYSPTTLDAYKKELLMNLRTRRLPRRQPR
jgi:hypothetical protein